MSILCDALRPYWLAGINEVSGQTSTSFRAWLTTGQYVFQSQTTGHISTFYAANSEDLTRSIAQDINRMAMAAFESMHGIPSGKDIPRSTAWPLLRSYYAAFYSAHAICRVFGVSVTQIDQEQTKQLNQAIQVVGFPSVLGVQQGLHRVEINSASGGFSISKLAPSSHEETWEQFGSLLDRLVQNLLSAPQSIPRRTAQDAAAFLMTILSIMRTSPCQRKGNWLSHMRNELNYKHMHGAWYPHERVSRFRTLVESNIASWKLDPMALSTTQGEVLAKFSQCCILIVALMRVLISDIAERNSNSDSFLAYGALRVLKQCA